MNTQNLFVVGWILTGIVASFLILEYYTLTPVMFLPGLGGAALVTKKNRLSGGGPRCSPQ